MIKIFSVEDDADLQDLLRYSLTNFGFDITLFSDAESMLPALSEKEELPDLILLDIMLPGMSGIDALKKLKASADTKDIPVIMLTAKSTEINIVNGLTEGAADYVTKPFSVVELSARIKANIRKSERSVKLVSGDIVMDLGSHEVSVGGLPVYMTLKEYGLLQELMKEPGIVQKRDDLLGKIWGYDFLGETRTLDMHIRTLRSKLGEHAEKIVTVRGIGYKFCP